MSLIPLTASICLILSYFISIFVDPIQLEISGSDTDTLCAISERIKKELALVPGATDVRDNVGSKNMDVKLIPKREALDFYDINQPDLAFQIRLAMATEEIGKFKMPGTQNDLKIIMGTAWPSRMGELGGSKEWDELSLLHVINPYGQRIPLLALVDYIVDEAPSNKTNSKISVRCKKNIT